MQVSRLVLWILVSSLRKVIMTISRRMASVFFMFLDMMDLSVLASVNAACIITDTIARAHSSYVRVTKNLWLKVCAHTFVY